MKLLILGGTLYLGRHTVEAALTLGHQVTLFNRGRTNPGLFPNVEHLVGDRDGNLAALEGRRWDAVIDPSGYLPRVVRAGCEVLRDAVQHYTFISSINAYADSTKPGMTEDDELAELPEGAPEEINGETYGPYKVLCEREVLSAFPGRSAVVRARRDRRPADHPGTELGDQVPVHVREHQHVEPLGCLDQLHAEGIDDPVVEVDLRILLRHAPHHL